MGKQWKQCQTLFFAIPKITADGDFTHEIKNKNKNKNTLALWKKTMTNKDRILKSRDIL